MKTETKALPIKDGHPKGPGWELKRAGEQYGENYNVWTRKFLRVGQMKIEQK